ncbi:MAG: hypothetical protein IPH20_26280 [Bacteroidales bacterium]|nr:hypothetical protein [Bacteroidales bacterium]
MMEISGWLSSTWLVAIAAIVAIPVLKVRLKSWFATFAILVSSVITGAFAIMAIKSNGLETYLYAGRFFGEIPLRIDGLSAWFILIVNFTSLMGALYGVGYMKSYHEQPRNLSFHWSLFVIFHLSMVWVCMVQHSLAFLIFWEFMSLSSMLLVMFEHQKAETLKAGINYLIQMHLGVALLTVAFIWVYASRQSFDFREIAFFFDNNPSLLLFFLFFAGFGIKAGFIPFHTWLPYAHPAAPSHVSGVMSGVIVKMGIYGILRVVSYLSAGSLLLIGEIILTVSVFSALYGILNASVHRDIKKMLAFCTIENIGIIGIGIGMGMVGKSTGNPYIMLAGFGGALLHTLNHSLFKSVLFFAAGNIYKMTHTRNMEHLGGLIRRMPFTAVAFLIGALAIGGLPPFNGFVSEFLIYSGLIEGIKSSSPEISTLMIMSIAGLAMAGGLSLITFTKTFGVVFLGNPRRQTAHEPLEVPAIMQAPMILILALIVAIGLAPGLLLRPLMAAIAPLGLTGGVSEPVNSTFSLLSSVGFASGFVVVLVVILLLLKKFITREAQVDVSPTWGCGYIAPDAGMQYTGKSFSKSLAKLFSMVAIEEKKYKEISPGNIFPKKRTYIARYNEFFETMIIDKALRWMLSFFNLFLFIHNGRIQTYILYGFFFILLVLAGSVLNLF